jgi:hypothetical protein
MTAGDWIAGLLSDRALYSSLFGALMGASAAAYLARYQTRRQRLLDEILACNVAIGQCIAIANSFLTLKKQVIRPISENYRSQRLMLADHCLSLAYGNPKALVVEFDFNLIRPIWTPVEALSSVVSERILTATRPSLVLASLVQAVHN